jgi:hypothetical protein
MENAPFETVTAFMHQTNLNPKLLIPALLKYDIRHNPVGVFDHQAIRFLEFCVQKLNNTDPAVHNFLLSLYVYQNVADDILIAYLKSDVGFVCNIGV